jgi:hypothetical protein
MLLAAISYYLSSQTDVWRTNAGVDLVPLQEFIKCDRSQPTIAEFSVGYNENHLVVIEFSPTDSIKSLDSLVGILGKEPVPPLDLTWNVSEDGRQIASGFPEDPPRGWLGLRGRIVGEFPARTTKGYRIEVKVGENFEHFRSSNPKLGVFAAPASLGFGNELIYSLLKCIFVLGGYALALLGIVLLAASLILFARQKNRRLTSGSS